MYTLQFVISMLQLQIRKKQADVKLVFEEKLPGVNQLLSRNDIS